MKLTDILMHPHWVVEQLMQPAERKRRIQQELNLAIEHLSHLIAKRPTQPLTELVAAEAAAEDEIERYGASHLGQLAGCVSAYKSCEHCQKPFAGGCELYDTLYRAAQAARAAKNFVDDVEECRAFISSLEDELEQLQRANYPRVRGAGDAE